MKINSTSIQRPKYGRNFSYAVCILLLFGFTRITRVRCPDGSSDPAPQARVDHFSGVYPGCTCMPDSWGISPPADIVHLNGLSGETACYNVNMPFPDVKDCITLPLKLKITGAAAQCYNGADGKATVLVSGGAQQHGEGHFITKDEFSLSGYLHLRAVDVDQDGDLDLFGDNDRYAHQLLLNDGLGHFSESHQFTTAPYYAAAGDGVFGDMDGDGDLDLITAPAGDEFLQVFLQGPTGQFTPGQVISPVFRVNSVELGDLDNDGDLDFWVGYLGFGGTYPKVFLNNGAGVFTDNGETYGDNAGVVKSIEIGDLNNDNYLDAFVVREFAPYEIFLNDGDGTFTQTSQTTLGTGEKGHYIVFGQFNSDVDNYPDAAVSVHGGPDRLYLNDGTGMFTPGNTFGGPGYGAGDLHLADFNGDGNLDLIAGDGIQIFNINGDGTLTQTFDFSPVNLNAASGYAIATGDFDGDCDIDVVGGSKLWINDESRTTPYLFNWSGGSATTGPLGNASTVTGLAPGTYTVTVTDADGVTTTASVTIGAPPAVTVSATSTDASCTVANDGTVSALGGGGAVFTLKNTGQNFPPDQAGGVQYFELTDLNGDNAPDIFAAFYTSGNPGNPEKVWLNNGDGTFPVAPVFTYDAIPAGTAVAVGNITGGSEPDAVLGAESRIVILAGNGDGTFTQTLVINSPDGVLHYGIVSQTWDVIKLADLDSDGDLDLIAGSRGYERITVYKNDPFGTFTLADDITGIPVTDVEVGKLNAGAVPDLFVSVYEQAPFVLSGNGDCTFTLLVQDYGKNFAWRDAELSDFDSDGNLDAVVAGNNELQNYTMLLFGNGDGTFDVSDQCFWNAGLIAAVGDLNGDGFPDIIVVEYTGASKIYLNDGNGVFEEVPQDFIPGYGSDSKLADIDGDSDLDLFTAHSGLGILTWLNQPNMYMYHWSTGANTADISGLAPGIYTVKVTDAGGCTAVVTVTVGNSNFQPPVLAGSNAPICTDADPLQLSETGGAQGVTWAWSGPGGYQSAAQNPVINNPTPAHSGDYTVVVTDDGNGCTNTQTIAVVVHSLPAVTCPTDQNIFDTQLPFQLDALAGLSPAGGAFSGTGVSGTSYTAGVGTINTMTYNYTDGNSCTNTCAFDISVSPAPTVALTYTDYCTGEPGPQVGLNGSDIGSTYQLQTGGGNLGAPVGGTGGPLSFGRYPNGLYQVVITSAGSTQTVTGTVAGIAMPCNIAVPNFCTCNAPDGRAAVTVKISAPSGQNWTIKAVIGLYSAASPPAPAAPVPMLVGTPLTYIGGNMYTLDGIRLTDRGYWVQVTNGSIDFDVMVGNAAW